MALWRVAKRGLVLLLGWNMPKEEGPTRAGRRSSGLISGREAARWVMDCCLGRSEEVYCRLATERETVCPTRDRLSCGLRVRGRRRGGRGLGQGGAG
jgi:hypothetical protein